MPKSPLNLIWIPSSVQEWKKFKTRESNKLTKGEITYFLHGMQNSNAHEYGTTDWVSDFQGKYAWVLEQRKSKYTKNQSIRECVSFIERNDRKPLLVPTKNPSSVPS